MVKLSLEKTLPVSVRVNDLKPGQLGIQIDKDHVWMRVNDRLMFTPRSTDHPWQLAPRNNMRVFVNLVPEGTEVAFKSAA